MAFLRPGPGVGGREPVSARADALGAQAPRGLQLYTECLWHNHLKIRLFFRIIVENGSCAVFDVTLQHIRRESDCRIFSHIGNAEFK